MTTLTTRRFATRAQLDQALTARIADAVAARGPSAIMLSGGQTPLPAYGALAGRVPLRDRGLHVLFSDERYVPADSPASNYHNARPLLDALKLPAESVLRVRTELALEEAARDYERQLAALLRSSVPIGLGLLGLGADGHTASLFGASDLERAQGRLAIAVHRPDGMSAVSVTPALLAGTGEPMFVVAGAGKEDALHALAAHDLGLTAWRAVQGCPRVELWLAPE
jgi:6-phosphogluconolactonase